MNKESLMKMGLTEEQATAVMAALDGAFVPKNRFNEVNEEKKRLQGVVAERDRQLETLKTENGTVGKLKEQIEALQAANAEKDKAHGAELLRLKREALDEKLLAEAKAIHPTACKPFLTAIDEGVDEEGYVALRKQQIEALTKAESTKFLFKTETGGQRTFVGVKPGETGAPATQTPGGNNPFDSKTYDEAAQIRMFRETPELAKALAKQAGVKFL